MAKDNAAQIAAMEKLGMTPEEIAETLAVDARIDKGEKLYELDENAEKVSKAARSVAKKPIVYKFEKKKERKPNAAKREIIQTLDDALCDLVDNVEVVNPERELMFVWDNVKYKIVLSVPRN